MTPKQSILIRSTFAQLYPLDSSQLGQDSYLKAIQSGGQGLVLKPQREGGGNNTYGSEIPNVLKTLSLEERSGYILMDLIQPPERIGVLVRNGELWHGNVVSELGVYGIWIR